jgi:preprotein translocase subunit SecE
VARDRKRAKQRRARRGRAGLPSAQAGGTPLRADVPGALDHASGEVDEFDAALVRGAGGVPADSETLSELEIEAEAEAEGDLTEDQLQEPAGPTRPGGGGGRAGGGGSGSGGGGDGGGVSPEQASGAPVRGNRAIGFLRASWAELQRVQWPDRRQVFQATAVVLGFVAIAGAYLGLADYVAKEIVEFIL